ncbi:NUDIX hydrolase [Massilia sp. 9096]|uniref:NUDIX hydrolase n=1 Tax=Massilia sp. 9096 TaxID=1500894 RepID=UPI0006905140|nr:NUDIX hydrolase [Massilia sp. 9096]
MSKMAVSCGTLVVDKDHRLLLCHVTGTAKWDIPKGMQDPGESELQAAVRELREESGLAFGADRFEELGRFDYRRDKALHLYKVDVGDTLPDLGHLVCTSYFPHHVTGKPTPEMDGFRWATRAELARLCWPRMAERLLGLDW